MMKLKHRCMYFWFVSSIVLAFFVIYLYLQGNSVSMWKLAVRTVNFTVISTNITASQLPHTTSHVEVQTVSTSFHRKQLVSTAVSIVATRKSKLCPEYSLGKMAKHSEWIPVTGTKDIYIYSAFLDVRSVRIIGAYRLGYNMVLYCQVWFQTTRQAYVTEARLDEIPENHDRRYSAVFVHCPLPNDKVPFAVSLVTDRCAKPGSVLPIIPTDTSAKSQRNFSVCVTPLNYRYNSVDQLIEWVEMNRILGADHFTFYNHSTGNDVVRVFKAYTKMGIAEVLPWHLPMGVDTWPKTNMPVEIHYFGQLAALNDCLYRNRYKTKFLVYEDLDEFIIPHSNKTFTWVQMMKKLPVAGAYLFRNTFFRKDWPDTNISFPLKSDAKKYKLVTLLKLTREETILPSSQRSKQIVRPKEVETIGIHNIWRMVDGRHVTTVGTNIGYLHHYRDWENPKDRTARVQDTRMLDYQTKLVENVRKAFMSLSQHKKKSEES